jgi:DNA-binding PadR family transcriptional regulator
MKGQRFLGELEQMAMLVVARLGGDAYGASIRRELEVRVGRRVTHGAAYVTLDRLEAKGYLSSTVGESGPRRGGRPRRYFTVTPEGAQALLTTRAAFEDLWDGMTELLERM